MAPRRTTASLSGNSAYITISKIVCIVGSSRGRTEVVTPEDRKVGFSHMRILFLDDEWIEDKWKWDPIVNDLVALGHLVEGVTTPDDATARLDQWQPDLIIVDHTLGPDSKRDWVHSVKFVRDQLI